MVQTKKLIQIQRSTIIECVCLVWNSQDRINLRKHFLGDGVIPGVTIIRGLFAYIIILAHLT